MDLSYSVYLISAISFVAVFLIGAVYSLDAADQPQTFEIDGSHSAVSFKPAVDHASPEPCSGHDHHEDKHQHDHCGVR